MLTPSPDDLDLIVRAAWAYYMDGLTQAQIAGRLFVSRQTVGRLLDSARHLGVVRVEINASYLGAYERALRLRDRLGLLDAIVVPGPVDAEPGRVNERVAAALAAYVRRYLHPGAVVGVGWGDTVARALAMLAPESLDDVTLASAAGSIQILTESLNGSVAARLRVVPAPLIVSSAQVASVLRQEQSVREVLDLAASAVVTLTGIGSADPRTASAVRRGVVTSADVERFAAAGAVGDMLGEWFDLRGHVVPVTSDRRIGLRLEQLRAMPNVVGVAAGLDKVTAIKGAVAGRLIKVLITDDPTAQAILDSPPAVPDPRRHARHVR